MAAEKHTRGGCAFCGKAFTRAGMAKHLAGCAGRAERIGAAGGEPERIFHLQVQDAYDGRFWLQLEMRGGATMQKLDDYLRAIWLECCGHLSEFTVGGAWSASRLGKTRRAAQVLGPGVEATHVYDFGTTSQTLVRVVAERTGPPLSRHPVFLMARNEAPARACQECGEPAAFLCMQCVSEEDRPGTLCAAHAGDHPHDEYGEPVEIVNSPRLGMCGYEGPAEPPY